MGALGLERAPWRLVGRGRDPPRPRLLDVRLLLPLRARGAGAARRLARSRRRPRSAPGRGGVSAARHAAGAAAGARRRRDAHLPRPRSARSRRRTSSAAPIRVMTTQILASKQNGDTDLAEVETVVLTAVAIAGLVAARRLERRRGRLAPARAPRRPRRAVRSPLGAPRARRRGLGRRAAAARAAPDPRAALARAARHLDDRAAAAGARGSTTGASSPPAARRCGRSATRSGWRSRRPPAPLVARLRGGARGAAARRASGARLELLIAIPWAVPATAFAVALATTMSVDRPWAGRFLLVGTLGAPAARLPGARPAVDRPGRPRRARPARLRRSRRRRLRSAPENSAGSGA